LSDLTYVPTDEGWLYLVGHRDLCSRKIVGYAMGARMTKNLVMESLLRAVETTKPPSGLLHHSDKGSQYCSHEYRRMLEGLGMKSSMSGTGNCFDNGVPRTPQGGALHEMRVLASRNRVAGPGSKPRRAAGVKSPGGERRRKGVINDVRCETGRRTQVNH
jgi:transposase InsO family protein